MPLSLPFLDYSVPEKDKDKIKIGQLVKIPFRNKEEFGVVLDVLTSDTTSKKLNQLAKLFLTNQFYPKRNWVFLVDISEFYHVGLGFLLKGNLLPLQTRKIKKVASVNKATGTTVNKPSKPKYSFIKMMRRKKNLF